MAAVMIQQLSSRLQRESAELQYAQETIARAHQCHLAAVAMIRQLEDKVDGAKLAMAQQTSSLLATRNELVEERASSAALRAHNVRFEQEAFTSSKKIAELEQEVEAVAAELTAARQQAHEKATEKSSEHWQSIIVSNMQAHKKMEDEQKKKVQKLAERIQQAEYGLGTMRQSLQEAEEVNATLIKERASKDQETGAYKSEKEASVAEAASLCAQLQEAALKSALDAEERINLRQEIEALKAGKERADKEIAHVHAEMQTMTNKAAIDAKNHLSNSASLQQQLQQQHNLRSSALEQLVSELRATNAVAAQEYKAQVTALQKELSDQEGKVKSISNEAAQLQTQVDQQLRIFKLQQEEERKLKADAKKASQSLESCSKQVATLEKEVAALKQAKTALSQCMQAPLQKKSGGLISAFPALRSNATGEASFDSPLQSNPPASAPFSPGTPTDALVDPNLGQGHLPGLKQNMSQQQLQVQGQGHFQPQGIIQGNAQPRGASQRRERVAGQSQGQPRGSVFERLQASSSNAAQASGQEAGAQTSVVQSQRGRGRRDSGRKPAPAAAPQSRQLPPYTPVAHCTEPLATGTRNIRWLHEYADEWAAATTACLPEGSPKSPSGYPVMLQDA